MDFLQRLKKGFASRFAGDPMLVNDLNYRMRVLESLIFGDKATSFQLVLMHHLIDGFTVQDNTPSVGYIQWSSLHIVYQGVDYTITNGNTNKKYAWWDRSVSTSTLQTTDTLPTLTDEDIIIFLNMDGTHATVPLSTALDGSLIVSESILANALAANCVTSDKIFAGAVIAEKIAAGAVTTLKLDALAVTAAKIAANTITAAKIAAGTITADELAALTITAAKIAADTITAGKLNIVGLDGDGKLALEQIGSGDLDNIGDGSTYGKVKATQLSSGEVVYQTADKDGLTVGDYVGKIVFDTGEGVHYTSDGTNWLVVNLSDEEVWGYGARKLTHGFTAAMFKRYFLHGADGDKTFSVSGSFPRHIMFYNNLTIDAAKVVDCVGEVQYIFVKGTLALNGTIRAQNGGSGGKAVANRGWGGDGGSAVIIFANTITGTGTITAAGGAATTPTVMNNWNGVNGTAGSFKDVTVPAGSGAKNTVSPYYGAGGDITTTGVFLLLDELESFLNDCQGAGGGSGAGAWGASYGYTAGGGGGAGVWGDGGQGGNATGISNNPGGAGGAGGGGGGFVMVMSFNTVPACTITANGGLGGHYYHGMGSGTPGGGGGGGGGIAVVIAPTINATISANGGTGRSNGGQNGVNGEVLSITADPREILT